MTLAQKNIEQKLKRLKPIIAKKYFVSSLGYFGSYATGKATELSDVDILVEFEKPLGWEFFDLQDYLEQELNLKVDLVSKNSLKKELSEQILEQVKYI